MNKIEKLIDKIDRMTLELNLLLSSNDYCQSVFNLSSKEYQKIIDSYEDIYNQVLELGAI